MRAFAIQVDERSPKPAVRPCPDAGLLGADATRDAMPNFALTEIGIARTPLLHRRDAPFQPDAQPGAVEGRIEIHPPYAQGLENLEGMERIWLLYVFHRNTGFRLRVRPPRGNQKRGLFSTRSPHRPSSIGMTNVKLLRVEGSILYVSGMDLLDETPIVDIKPYLHFVDAHPHAKAGWLDALSLDDAPEEKT